MNRGGTWLWHRPLYQILQKCRETTSFVGFAVAQFFVSTVAVGEWVMVEGESNFFPMPITFFRRFSPFVRNL